MYSTNLLRGRRLAGPVQDQAATGREAVRRSVLDLRHHAVGPPTRCTEDDRERDRIRIAAQIRRLVGSLHRHGLGIDGE